VDTDEKGPAVIAGPFFVITLMSLRAIARQPRRLHIEHDEVASSFLLAMTFFIVPSKPQPHIPPAPGAHPNAIQTVYDDYPLARLLCRAQQALPKL